MELLRVNLADAGYDVRAVADAEAAEREIARALPTLVLLDWMLPRQVGIGVRPRARSDARTRLLPIIMVTARTDEADKVAGLEAGSTTT
jgi:two-component system phosphate regulon response regulator PhoB